MPMICILGEPIKIVESTLPIFGQIYQSNNSPKRENLPIFAQLYQLNSSLKMVNKLVGCTCTCVISCHQYNNPNNAGTIVLNFLCLANFDFPLFIILDVFPYVWFNHDNFHLFLYDFPLSDNLQILVAHNAMSSIISFLFLTINDMMLAFFSLIKIANLTTTIMLRGKL